MKTWVRFLAVAALAPVLSASVYSSDVRERIGSAVYDRAVANLLLGLKSENPGLQRSAALMLGEMQAGKALIPLMEALHRPNDERVRIAAAWALCRISDGRGTYAVKQAARFDESEKVRAACAWYYNLYVRQHAFALSGNIEHAATFGAK